MLNITFDCQLPRNPGSVIVKARGNSQEKQIDPNFDRIYNPDLVSEKPARHTTDDFFKILFLE